MNSKLSVNLNKVALLRNQRHVGYPDPVTAGRTILEAGAHGLTVHPRPDERHIRKTDVHEPREDRMPYAVDVIALDQQGIVYHLADFFSSRDIEIADVATRRYAAAHTGAPMFAVQMAVNIPARLNLAQLREEFLELGDRLNLDAILEPVKN